MMKKGFVTYARRDDYDNQTGKVIEWFDTVEKAQARADEVKRGNGAYVEILKVGEGDYAEYYRKETLIAHYQAKIAELEEEKRNIYERD